MSDPNFSSVHVLLHMDGADNGTVFTDSSSFNRSITRFNGTVTSATQAKFGATSAQFVGNNALTITSPDLAGAFTVECWIYPTASGFTQSILTFAPSNKSLALRTSGVLGLRSGGGGYDLTGPTTVSLNTWHHIVWQRDAGGVQQMYLDGALQGSRVSGSTYSSSSGLNIGAYAPVTADPFNGFIDDVRVTIGVARYTDPFTPPSAPFPDFAGVSGIGDALAGVSADGIGSFAEPVTGVGEAEVLPSVSGAGQFVLTFVGTGDALVPVDAFGMHNPQITGTGAADVAVEATGGATFLPLVVATGAAAAGVAANGAGQVNVVQGLGSATAVVTSSGAGRYGNSMPFAVTESGVLSSSATLARTALLSESAELDDAVSSMAFSVAGESAQVSSAVFASALRVPLVLSETATLASFATPFQLTVLTLSETAQLSGVALVPNDAVVVVETARVSDSALVAPKLRFDVSAQARAGDRTFIGGLLVVTESAVLDDAVSAARIRTALTENAVLGSAAFAVKDTGLLVTESAVVTSAAVSVLRSVAQTAEQAFVTDAVYDRHVLSGGQVVANAVAWTANLGNWAMSRYTGFEFNSMTDEFAASEHGLYARGTESVVGAFESGRARLDASVKAKLEYVYSDCSTPSPMAIVVSGDTPAGFASHTYTQLARNLSTSKAARAKVGRGFNSSFYSVAHRSSAEFIVHKAELVFNETARKI